MANIKSRAATIRNRSVTGGARISRFIGSFGLGRGKRLLARTSRRSSLPCLRAQHASDSRLPVTDRLPTIRLLFDVFTQFRFAPAAEVGVMRKRGLNDSEVLHKACLAIPLFSHPRDIRLIRPVRAHTRPCLRICVKIPTARC